MSRPSRIVFALAVGHLIGSALLPNSACAQASNSSSSSETEFSTGIVRQWRCKLPGTGFYAVALRSVTAVAVHEYNVDNAARVTEVNIDTTGSALARFYFLEPLTPQAPSGIGQGVVNKVQEMATDAATRTGQEELWKKVVKNYPTTTHARTIEYRIDSKEQLMKIFKSADGAVRDFKDTSITVQ